MTTTEIKELMSTKTLWNVTFTKLNGDRRRMFCSRDWAFLEEHSEDTGYSKPENESNYNAEEKGLVRVWDCYELGWRTIPTGERLISIEPVEED